MKTIIFWLRYGRPSVSELIVEIVERHIAEVED